ncbi:Phosphoglucosamine mutase [hydrothermal vent metagenome]|uniref:Phosphoglucosamine mutase n=1 Tax=hydrothermal vent metagenome TaxID=652676 RepID=A0A3B0YPG1_9ZZZZ
MQRKYFGTDGIRGEVGIAPICPEFMLRLGWAIGQVFGRTSCSAQAKAIIGKDTRISGYMFESALESGLAAAGMDVLLLGPMPTPGIAYLTRTLHADAGIVISASHNAYQDNGVKFFNAKGTKLPNEIELEIEGLIDQPMKTVGAAQLGKAERVGDAAGRYIEFCKSSVPTGTSLTGLKIVVDCAHGATYHISPKVFYELGAEVISIGVSPDGLNINHQCGSTDLDQIKKTVVEQGADIGVALDGDGDRVILINHIGEEVDGDEILFIIAKARAQQNSLRGTVVGTLMSNLGLEHALQKLSIDFVRSAVGDRYVMEKMKALDSTLGGEGSGHIICLDRTTTGDGTISALQVLAYMVESQQSVKQLSEGMKKYPQKLINVPVTDRIDLEKNSCISAGMKNLEAELGDGGRVLLRYSGTEPLVRVMVEGQKEDQVNRLAGQLAQVVKDTIGSV